VDEGLKQAIAMAGGDAKRPLAIEVLIDLCRRNQSVARQKLAQPKPDRPAAQRYLMLAHASGREAAAYLPPGGELRRRLEIGELMSEQDWERLCGPPIPAETTLRPHR
jgi:hypothetical protein